MIIYLLFYSFFIYFYRDFRKLSKTGPIYNPSVYSDWYLAMHLKSITLPTLDTLQRKGKHVPSWKSHFENLEESFFYHDLTESLHSGQLTPPKKSTKIHKIRHVRPAMHGEALWETILASVRNVSNATKCTWNPSLCGDIMTVFRIPSGKNSVRQKDSLCSLFKKSRSHVVIRVCCVILENTKISWWGRGTVCLCYVNVKSKQGLLKLFTFELVL